MASIQEVREGIAAAIEEANEALGATQQAHASLEGALGQLNTATEGSGQADATDARSMWAQTVEDLANASRVISAGISSAGGVANRL